MRHLRVFALLIAVGACGGKKEGEPIPDKTPDTKPAPKTDPKPEPKPEPKPATGSVAEKPVGSGSAAGPNTPMVADAPEGNPPPDGKYERVSVEGTTVPMVQVMDGGTIVLVDTDGKKPRTWEEQYKKKKATKKGQLDIHKTDKNKNGKFDEDEIDREGLWLIDVKGNIVKH